MCSGIRLGKKLQHDCRQISVVCDEAEVELRLRCDCRTGQVNGYVLTTVSPGANKHLIVVIGFTPVNYNRMQLLPTQQ